MRVHDERLCRMWECFVATSAMGFRLGRLMAYQMQLVRRVDAVPLTRDYPFAAEAAIRAVTASPVRLRG